MNHKNIKFTDKNNLTFYHMFKRFFITEKTVNYELNMATITFIAPNWCTKTLVKRCINLMCNNGDEKSSDVISIRVLNTAEKIKIKHTKAGKMTCTKSSEKKFIVKLKSPDKLKEVLL